MKLQEGVGREEKTRKVIEKETKCCMVSLVCRNYINNSCTHIFDMKANGGIFEGRGLSRRMGRQGRGRGTIKAKDNHTCV